MYQRSNMNVTKQNGYGGGQKAKESAIYTHNFFNMAY